MIFGYDHLYYRLGSPRGGAMDTLTQTRLRELDLVQHRGDAVGKILTYTGRYIDPLRPDPKDIDIRDIAHALSMVCRYAGQVPVFYSVAQHSVLVSRKFSWPYDRMNGLLHDAEEAYLGDMASPIKKSFPEYAAAGDRLRLAILDKYSIAYNPEDGLCEFIHEADDELYRWERRSLWGDADDWRNDPSLIRPWWPETAEMEFLREFDVINKQIEDLRDGR